MKKKVYVLLLATLLGLTGCGGTNESDVSEEIAMKLEYSDGELQGDKLELQKYALTYPQEATLSTFCVKDEMIYYGLVYSVPFESATSEEDVPEFIPEYNTQIRSCNMQNGEEQVLYTYTAEHYIEISDMCCNGEALVWEDYNVDDTWWL